MAEREGVVVHAVEGEGFGVAVGYGAEDLEIGQGEGGVVKGADIAEGGGRDFAVVAGETFGDGRAGDGQGAEVERVVNLSLEGRDVKVGQGDFVAAEGIRAELDVIAADGKFGGIRAADSKLRAALLIFVLNRAVGECEVIAGGDWRADR